MARHEPEPRVLVLDDLGDWRGLGTALHLAERGHDVTLVTSAPVVAGGLFHSAADGPLRERFARAGGRSITGSVVVSWRPGAAVVRTTLSGETRELPADTLVIAETAVAGHGPGRRPDRGRGPVPRRRRLRGARRASLAFYEGRALGLPPLTRPTCAGPDPPARRVRTMDRSAGPPRGSDR